MGKVMVKKIKGLSWTAKVSLILICTLLTSVFMYQGWYKPQSLKAAIGTTTGWTTLGSTYHTATKTPTVNIAVSGTASTNRLLVVGVTYVSTAAGTATCSVSYKGTPLTLAAGDAAASSSLTHTWLFYLKEDNTLMNGVTGALAATITTATTQLMTDAYYMVLNGVDQTNPLGSSARPTANRTNISGAAVAFSAGSGLLVNAAEQAVAIYDVVRSGNTSTQTLTGFGSAWTSSQNQSSTTTNANHSYVNYQTSVPGSNQAEDLCGATAGSGSDITSVTAVSFRAAAVNTTTAGTATATAISDTAIKISMPYVDDTNGNNTAFVEWQIAGSGAWDNNSGTITHSSSPYTYTITGLLPNTAYDVRVTYTDSDGVTGTAVQTFSGATRLTTGSILNSVPWTAAYSGTNLTMTGNNVTVPADPNRILLVGISVAISSAAPVADPTLVQYGGVTLTKATGYSTSSSHRNHTWLYYLPENAIMDGAPHSVDVTFGAISNLVNLSVYTAVYRGVDPITPVGVVGNSTTTSAGTAPALSAAMTINPYYLPVFITSIYNAASAPTYTMPSSWNSALTTTPVSTVRVQAATRDLVNSGTPTDSATGTLSSSSYFAVSALTLKQYVPPPPGTTLSDGVKATANPNVCSSATNLKINGFSLINTKTGSDTVTDLTVTTTNGASTIASMSIWDEAGTTQYFATLNAPTAGETWFFSGGTSIPVTGVTKGYKVLVSYKAGLPNGTATTAQITTYTSSDLDKFITNTAQGTLTTLNAAPTAPTTRSASGNGVRWNAGGTGTAGYLVVRYATNTDVTAPVDGTIYTVGNSFGVDGTVVYVGTGTTYTEITPGSYYYRIFGYGACYNYTASHWANSGAYFHFPGVTSISPNQFGQGTAQVVTITGAGLTGLTTLTFSGVTTPVIASNIVVINDTQATATITATASASIGTNNVTASNGTQNTATNGVITVNAPAVVSTVTPGVLHQGESISMTITGSGFQAGASVTFSSSGVTASNVNVASANQLTADVAITAGAPLGARNVTVTNPDAGSGTVSGLVTVIPPLATTSGVISFPHETGTSITVQATYSGDGNNSNSCVIEWGTQNGVYTNSVAATKTVYGIFTATVNGLTGGSEGAGKQYYFRATFTDGDGVIGGVLKGSHATAASHLMHNSQNLDSTKWDQGWGIPDGKYGTFVCSTCHNPNTTNIKLVRTSIQSPSLENWSSSGGTSNAVNVTFLNPAINTGSDTAHATSTNTCEVCHSRTDHHRYNNPGANHKGTTDCVECHNHSVAFAPDSVGNRNCADCHNPLVNSMSTDTLTYHHYVDPTAVASTTYPTTTTPADADKTCLQCHVQHNIFRSDLNPTNTIGRSANLRVDAGTAPVQGTAPGAGYANTDFVASATNGGVCTSCHVNTQTKSTVQKNNGTTVTHTVDKSDFTGSMHNYTTASSFRRDGSRFLGNCSKCHNDNMTKKYQASTGDQFSNHVNDVQDMLNPLGNPNAADPYNEQFCYRCHSKANDMLPDAGKQKSNDNKDWYGVRTMGNDSIDVFSAFYDNPTTTPTPKANGHTVSAYSGQHKQTVTDENLAYIAANKHIECADCHNPHHAGNANRPQASGGTPTNAIGTNSPIGGVSGVTVDTWPAMPATAALWTATTLGASYTLNPSSSQEWQVCMKCHSGANASVLSWGAAGAGSWTDVGLEFNPNNASAHPVVVSLNNLVGSKGTKPVTAARMKAPWAANVGNQTMYCTDCHSTDSAASKGPHGSAVKWMLAGTNKAWPYTTAAGNGGSTGTFFRIATYNTGDGTKDGLFCLNCHTIRPASGGNSWHTNGDVTGGQHGSNAITACASCHIRVPHGGKVSRLLLTTNTPARYRGDGNGNYASSGNSFDSWGPNTNGGIKGASVSSSNFNSTCGTHNSGAGESW